MARRSSGGRSSGFSSRPVRNPPKPASSAPPPARAPAQGGSIMGGFVSSIADGFGWGAGISVAQRAVDAVFGPRVIRSEVVKSEAPPVQAPAPGAAISDSCSLQSKAFQDCLEHSGSDISKCQFYMDMLSDCRKSSAPGGFNV